MDAATAYGFLKLRQMDIAAATKADEHAHGISAFLSNFDDRNEILGYANQPRATWYAASGAYHLQLLLQLESDAQDIEGLNNIFDKLIHAQKVRSCWHLLHDIRLVEHLRTGTVVSLNFLRKSRCPIRLKVR